jgi:hypothetical protein
MTFCQAFKKTEKRVVIFSQIWQKDRSICPFLGCSLGLAYQLLKGGQTQSFFIYSQKEVQPHGKNYRHRLRNDQLLRSSHGGQ